MANSLDGQNTVLSVVGILAPTPHTLNYVFSAIVNQKPWLNDPSVLNTSFQPYELQERLCFGLLNHDGQVKPHPPILRGLRKLQEALSRHGHKVVPWDPTPNHAELTDIMLQVATYDGGADIHDALDLSGEPPIPQIQSLYGKRGDQMNASEIAKTNVRKRNAQKSYLEFWNRKETELGCNVDAIISPVAPWSANRPEKYIYFGYTIWVNVLVSVNSFLSIHH